MAHALQKYHDNTSLPLMVSLVCALQHAKNTIDDADYTINPIDLFFIIQQVKNTSHSHSIINKPFLSILFNGLFS
ncbi:MAG: hypothetical protein KZQ58_00625 [gamma proteobacterium symbiont of Bathyaustriella thionipta]|nr:hypothetical protein [gamma proteobacterium symbiont of Bathyaustriella thionipta]